MMSLGFFCLEDRFFNLTAKGTTLDTALGFGRLLSISDLETVNLILESVALSRLFLFEGFFCTALES